MKLFVIIFCIAVVFVTLLAIVFICNRRKYQFYRIRIEEAEKNIEYFLSKKQENLEKTIPIIKESNKKKYKNKKNEVLGNLIKNKNLKFTLQEQDDNLRQDKSEFLKLLEDNEKLLKNKDLVEIYYEGIEIENDLTASKKYYNQVARRMEEDFQKFPGTILKNLFGYEPLERFHLMKDEAFEILKEKETSEA